MDLYTVLRQTLHSHYFGVLDMLETLCLRTQLICTGALNSLQTFGTAAPRTWALVPDSLRFQAPKTGSTCSLQNCPPHCPGEGAVDLYWVTLTTSKPINMPEK